MADPQLIGHWYLEYLFESKVITSFIRLDKGTEMGTVATMHAYLHQFNDAVTDPTETVIYGLSTSNQVIITVSGYNCIILHHLTC